MLLLLLFVVVCCCCGCCCCCCCLLLLFVVCCLLLSFFFHLSLSASPSFFSLLPSLMTLLSLLPLLNIFSYTGKLVTESNSARSVDLSSANLPSTVLVKSDGASVYLLRDYAHAIQRLEQVRQMGFLFLNLLFFFFLFSSIAKPSSYACLTNEKQKIKQKTFLYVRSTNQRKCYTWPASNKNCISDSFLQC